MGNRQIIDDGFEHSLSLIQDDRTGSLRLHAAVWNGELRRCPVWTAFSMLPLFISSLFFPFSFLPKPFPPRIVFFIFRPWKLTQPQVTHQSESPKWMDRRGSHRIILKDIKLYVFCGNYEKNHQMRKNGGFEIYFVERKGMFFSSLLFSFPFPLLRIVLSAAE